LGSNSNGCFHFAFVITQKCLNQYAIKASFPFLLSADCFC